MKNSATEEPISAAQTEYVLSDRIATLESEVEQLRADLTAAQAQVKALGKHNKELTVELNIDLVFEDWQGPDGQSVYYTEQGVELGGMSFHHGSTFPATIQLDPGDDDELREAIKRGFTPVFAVCLPLDNGEVKP